MVLWGPRACAGRWERKKTLKRLKRPAGKGALFSGGFFHLHRYFQRPRAKRDHPRLAQRLLRDMVTFMTGKNKGKRALGRMAASFSGEKQLIAISRAFLSKAKIIILDEATSYVDTKQKKKFKKLWLNL